METDQDFFDEINANPDDMSVRMVYADWLEERGDPRAEFIEVQCALADMDRSHPERAPMEQIEWHLRKRHEREWFGPLCGPEIEFTLAGGFVDTLRIGVAEFAKVSSRLDACAVGMRNLRLTAKRQGTATQGVVELARSQAARSLRKLDLSYCWLTNRDVKHLASSPHLSGLKSLNLSWNDWIGDAGVEWLSDGEGLPALAELDLRFVGFGKAGMRILAESSKLKSLGLLAINPQLRRKGYQYSIRHLQDVYGDRLVVY
ncbi:MAG: TIGR02996 domain-containing protein [Pirellulales bacterium]|nr:TIGR02996 domain-containing protein [Pirellulales bacterium]